MLLNIFGLILPQLVLLILCSAAEDKKPFDKIALKKEIVRSLRKVYKDSAVPEEEKDPAYWRNVGYQELKTNLEKKKLNLNKAKNVIFFLGDGMSSSTVAAARINQGQRKNKPGEGEQLSFEKFPYTGFSKTYCTNIQVGDSACTATAYMCGVKGNSLTIGVSANVHFNNCTESMDPANQVSSIAAWAQKAGKSTGFITTSLLTDASPSGAYAHVSNRFHESDADVEEYGGDPAECIDIAKQLVMKEPGKNFDIIMGGGMSKFVPNNTRDLHGNIGERRDGQNLLNTWQDMHPQGVIVKNREELLKVDVTKVSNIMGIFDSKKMDYHLNTKLEQPTLTEMTEAAIKLMQRNPKGYLLFVEGALIDKAHHETKAAIAIDETLEMANAIERARHITKKKDTLIVTTADHSHPLTILGFPERGSNILGLDHQFPDSNREKYFTLNYAMGPKQYLDENGKRLNMEHVVVDKDFEYPGYIHSDLGQHSGDDVGIYASGPHAHLFTGVIEQSTIPHLIAYAACMGDGPTLCKKHTHNKSYWTQH